MNRFYHTDTRPLWAYDADTDTLTHEATGYWLPAHGCNADHWLCHVSQKSWASSTNLDALRQAYLSANQAAAA